MKELKQNDINNIIEILEDYKSKTVEELKEYLFIKHVRQMVKF